MVVVVPVPPGEDGALVIGTDLDGEPVLVHTVRRATELGAPVVVVAPVDAYDAVTRAVAAAGLATRAGVSVARAVDAGGLAAAVTEAYPSRPDSTALLVHDPLCPLAPSSHLLTVLDAALAADGSWTAAAGAHLVTDTVKTVHQDDRGLVLGGTVDRDALRMVTTPVLVPAGAAAHVTAAGGAPGLVRQLRAHGHVALLPSPPLARRVHDRSGLDLVLGLRDVEVTHTGG